MMLTFLHLREDPTLDGQQKQPIVRAYGIVPAAGASRRMGRAKLLLPWGDTTVLDTVLGQWQRSSVHETVVVAGALADEYGPIVRAHHATLLVPEPEPGEMIESIRAAVTWVAARHPAPHDAVLIAPADQPRITARLIDRVLSAYSAQAPCVIQPSDGKSHGHPVLLPWSTAVGVLGLAPDETLRDLLQSVPRRTVGWHHPADWHDIDTLDDYHRLRNASGQP